MKPFIDKESGNSVCAQGTFNKILFHMNYGIDECDHSCLELKVFPQQEGTKLFLHVLIGNQELLDSPKPIEIIKSEKHKAYEQE